MWVNVWDPLQPWAALPYLLGTCINLITFGKLNYLCLLTTCTYKWLPEGKVSFMITTSVKLHMYSNIKGQKYSIASKNKAIMKIYVLYHMEGNFDSEKIWQIHCMNTLVEEDLANCEIL